MEGATGMNRKRLSFNFQWEAAGNDVLELYQTMARLSLVVNDHSLTRNEDGWSRTVKDEVLVSLYPLATWFASSWWRLLYEPHPGKWVRPSVSWRMAHEMASANHGFVWPTVMFATDGDGIQVWSSPSDQKVEQSVRYLNGSRFPSFVPMTDFCKEVAGFIDSVVNRLRDSDGADSELAVLWALVREEQADPELTRLRMFEAMMGYDPEECPEALLKTMLALSDKVGEKSLSELMAALAMGQEFQVEQEQKIELFSELRGLEGRPDIPQSVGSRVETEMCAPWVLAVRDAKDIRDHLGQGWDPITNKQLFDVLGLHADSVEHYTPENTSRASVAIPIEHSRIRFIPRKKHPTARRFEYARLLADCIFQQRDDGWLVSSDLGTFRQKYQRAFAAELLCPVEGAKQFMQGDYSESAIEDVAEHFDVSATTVTALLMNNHLIESDDFSSNTGAWPYRPLVVSA